MKKISVLILVALILCALFYGLTLLNLPWFVVLYTSHGVETILGLLLGLCVAHLIYNEDNEHDER